LPRDRCTRKLEGESRSFLLGAEMFCEFSGVLEN